MILVDTSVWVGHFRTGDPDLASILDKGLVATHAFVIGELACGNLRNRAEILGLLLSLHRAPIAEESEVLTLIERHSLMGRGVGYIDMHLLTSASVETGLVIWTRDQRLATIAGELGLTYST